MSDRICLCVGVSSYIDEALQALPGAALDAQSVYDALVDPKIGAYDETKSCLLLDATKEEVVGALAELLYGNSVGTFTFFFAGHGGSKNESYAVCCSDTELDRYGLSALAIGELFRLVNDARPLHSNIIIDACNAAGVLSDFGDLLKPSVLGPANSSSVSILAMSASDRFAQETEDGGLGTTALLRCLRGEIEASVRKEYLSLEDVGSAIAPLLEDQSPTTWSFAISGASKFSKNPSFSDDATGMSVPISSFGTSASSMISKQNAELVWKEYMQTSEQADLRRLQELIVHVLQEIESADDQANLLLGLFESFSARAVLSEDAFAIVEVQSAFCFAAGCISDEDVHSRLAAYLLGQLDQSLSDAVQHFVECLSEDYGLVAKGAAFSEFFSLPIRISKVAAWTVASIYLADDESTRTERIRLARTVLDGLTGQYENSFSLVSEEQAAYVHVISSLAPSYGLTEWSEEYISTLYADYFFFRQHVAKTRLEPSDVFDFLKYRIAQEPIDYRRFSAKPTELLFTLLFHFLWSERKDIVRFDFADLDHIHVSTYLPDSFSSFSDEVIFEGANIGFTIGFDVFTVDDFESFVLSNILPKAKAASEQLSPLDLRVALLASLIYPNRIAWFLSVEANGSA